MASEWERLKARYWSKGAYVKRQVIEGFYSNKEDFVNFLVDEGAEILLEPKQSEEFRFRLNGELGIVYTKGSGNLLAHDMGRKYDSVKSQKYHSAKNTTQSLLKN